MGQVILVLLLIFLLCTAKYVPNLVRTLNGDPPEEEPLPALKRLARVAFLIACAAMLGYIALRTVDGTFAQLISSLRR